MTQSAAVVLTLLPPALQPQPNVRLKLGQYHPVTQADFKRKPGRRLQRNGLLYHPGFPGFDPSSWPHVIDPVTGYNGDGCREARVMVNTLASPRSRRRYPPLADLLTAALLPSVVPQVPCERQGGPPATLVDVIQPATSSFKEPIKKASRSAAVSACDHNRVVRVGEGGIMVRHPLSNHHLALSVDGWLSQLWSNTPSGGAWSQAHTALLHHLTQMFRRAHHPKALTQVGIGWHRSMRGLVERYMVEKP